MHIEIIPLSQLQTDTTGLLTKCCDSGQPVVVRLPDDRFVAIQPLDANDEDDTLVSDLIDSNAEFRNLLQKLATSPRKPFAATSAGPK